MAVNPATSPAVTQIVKALEVSWTNSTTVGATYTIYRSRGTGCSGVFVPVATVPTTPYIDYNVITGEIYSYYIIAHVGNVNSTATAIVSLTHIGPQDQNLATLTSSDALTDRRGATTVYAGIVSAGCGEYQRLQQLRGRSTLCGK